MTRDENDDARVEAERLRAVIVEYLAAGAAHDEATWLLARATSAADLPPLWRQHAEAVRRWATARIALLAAGAP